MAEKAAKSAKGRKIGRNKDACKRYRLEQRRERNKLRKLAKHMRGLGKAPGDMPADFRVAFENLHVTLPAHIVKQALRLGA